MQLPAVPVSQTPEEKFRDYLASRPRPQRFTDQQRAMVRYIFTQHEHFDADQLTEDLNRDRAARNQEKISRATVYRTLNKLVDAGLLRSVETGPRKVYEHDYGYPHHYHMVCGVCRDRIEFESAAVEAIVREVCRAHKFLASKHTFEIRGTCTRCNTRRRLDLI